MGLSKQVLDASDLSALKGHRLVGAEDGALLGGQSEPPGFFSSRDRARADVTSPPASNTGAVAHADVDE
jgi:hypothetical protein